MEIKDRHNFSTGLELIVVGLIFATVETTLFGGNLFPGSFLELICDLVALWLVIGGGIISTNAVFEEEKSLKKVRK